MAARPTIMLTVHVLGQGGTDRVCAHLARGFAEAGYNTEVLVLATGGQATAALLPLFGPNVLLTFLGARGRSRGSDIMRRFPALVRHLARSRPDIVLSTGNNMNWVTALAVRVAGIGARLALKTTNPIARPKDSRLKVAIRHFGYARAFAMADTVLTLSDAETRQLCAAFPRQADRFRTVANPYITSAMLADSHAPRGPRGPRGPARLVLGIGRLEPQKQFDLLLEAFARLDDPAARLTILGEGPDRLVLERQIAALGIGDRVTMPGFVTDIAAWLARADLFVLSSRYEGLPAVVIEAMAANCPVVTTDCFAAARELVADAEGCAVVDGGHPDALARAMAASLAAPRPATLDTVARRYSVDTAIRDHIDAVVPAYRGADPVPAKIRAPGRT